MSILNRVAIGAFAATTLVACATDFSEVAPRGGWRAEAERACMDRRSAAKPVASDAQSAAGAATPAIVELPAIIEDPCGIDYPLKVSALGNGQTVISPVATLGCPLTEALDAWLQESVQPAARKWIGSPVVEIKNISNYACRKRNSFGKGYSEHAFGNALDISGYKFADGRETTYAADAKNGPEDIRGFYDEIFASACQRFTTLLGPGFNILHYNHIHVDLAIVAPDKSPKMCKPTPEGTPQQRAPFDGDAVATVPVISAPANQSPGLPPTHR